jgi:hypothetical protein
VKIWTAHTRPETPPVLVREGFSWGALLFGPFWLFAHRAWVAGVLSLCAAIVLVLLDGRIGPILVLGLAWLLGLTGRDLWRWSLDRRGFTAAHVIAASNADGAFARLLARRPDLTADAAK